MWLDFSFSFQLFLPIDDGLTAGALTTNHHSTDKAKCWAFHLKIEIKIDFKNSFVKFLTSPAEGPLTLLGQVNAAARFIRSV